MALLSISHNIVLNWVNILLLSKVIWEVASCSASVIPELVKILSREFSTITCLSLEQVNTVMTAFQSTWSLCTMKEVSPC